MGSEEDRSGLSGRWAGRAAQGAGLAESLCVTSLLPSDATLGLGGNSHLSLWFEISPTAGPRTHSLRCL